jgi:type IV pilus assembly protein PilV
MGPVTGMPARRGQGGALMIEVLVTIVILAIGLLGLMQMQGRLQRSEMESYQRTQALILANDMAARVSSNRANAADYATANPLPGVNLATADCGNPAALDTTQEIDRAEWCLALQGAAEETSGGTNVGAMIGGRGCVEKITDQDYMITVVWQGLTPIAPPPATVTCGANLYNLPAGSACADNADACRRYVTTWVSIGNLKI